MGTCPNPSRLTFRSGRGAPAATSEIRVESGAPVSTTTPSVTPLLCRLNVRHKWRMEYPTEGPQYGWCIRCRKVDPTWSGWEWKDLLWMNFPGGNGLGIGNPWADGDSGSGGDDGGGGDGGGDGGE